MPDVTARQRTNGVGRRTIARRAQHRRSVRSIARRERARSDRYVARYLASAQFRTSPAHRDRPSDGAYGTERVGSRRPRVSARARVGWGSRGGTTARRRRAAPSDRPPLVSAGSGKAIR